jgi:hypothetical protein
VKAMAKTHSKGFQYLGKKFPNISTAKLKDVIFVGPQTQEVLKNEPFVESVNDTEQAGWEGFWWVCANFLRRKTSPDFSDNIHKLLNAYKEIGCCMSLKVHILHSHLYFSPQNLGEVSDEQGEHFLSFIVQLDNTYWF